MLRISHERFERLDLDEIRRNHPLPDVVGGAGVDLKRAGRELKACCPFHPDKTPSFTIYEGGLRWHCFGGCGGGDVFDFLARLHDVGLREAAEMLTGGAAPSVYIPPLPVDDSPDRTDEARAIWKGSSPVAGTLAEAYLRSRALHLTIPDSIRFSSLRYGSRGPVHPVLVAAVTSATDELIGVQRTYLRSDGLGKLDVDKPKLSLGRVSGGAIRCAPWAAKLVVAEGLEDALSLQQVLGQSVWCAAGASMLPSMAFPAGVRSVMIGGDNDVAGRAAARKAADNFALRGLEAGMFFPLDAKDFNAELMEGSRI